MDDTPEFTPKENFHANLYRDPQALFKRALFRALSYLIPSVGLMIVWLITRDPAYAIVGYGILLYQAVNRLFLMKRGMQTTGSIIKKYETRREVGRTPPNTAPPASGLPANPKTGGDSTSAPSGDGSGLKS
jgi:hypothetical protein